MALVWLRRDDEILREGILMCVWQDLMLSAMVSIWEEE